MIVVLGDLENSVEMGIAIAARARGYRPGLIPVIQVGDLRWNPARPIRTPPWPIHFCDGNHDSLPSLLLDEKGGVRTEPSEVAPNWIYCPRGSVVRLDGKNVGFLGGARSRDREDRVFGGDLAAGRAMATDYEWWNEEEVTSQEAARFRGHKVDLLITHTPPTFVVKAMGFDDPDYSSLVVEMTWEALGKPRLICGHMHQHFQMGNVTVLGDLDAIDLP